MPTYRKLTVTEMTDDLVVEEGKESWIDVNCITKDFHENLNTGINNKINMGGTLCTITAIEEDYNP